MILFTKPNCEKCDWIKAHCDLSGVEVQELDENPEALGLLAYYECVVPAEKGLPILVVTAGTEAGATPSPFNAEVILELDAIAEKLARGNPPVSPFHKGGEDCGDSCAF